MRTCTGSFVLYGRERLRAWLRRVAGRRRRHARAWVTRVLGRNEREEQDEDEDKGNDQNAIHQGLETPELVRASLGGILPRPLDTHTTFFTFEQSKGEEKGSGSPGTG